MITLQTCQHCQTVHYPQRDICPKCLSDALTWEDISGEGIMVSNTELHISTKKKWQDQLPLSLGLVKLKAGPILLAFSQTDLPIGMAVTLVQDGGILKIQTGTHDG